MNVLFLTTLFSVFFASLFVLLYLRSQKTNHDTSPEQDSLIPFRDDDDTTSDN